MGFSDLVLRKRLFRSDAIWARPFFYRFSIVRSIPFAWDTGAVMSSQYWDSERLGRYQDVRIRELIQNAARLPLWKRVFEESALKLEGPLDRGTLARLPACDKQTFTSLPENDYVDERYLPGSIKDQTSGSTGRPFSYYHNIGYVLRSYAMSERFQRVASGGPRLPLIIIRRGARAGFAFKKFDFFYLEGYTALKHRLDALLELIRSRGKVVLFLWGSVATELARLLVERGEKPAIGGLIVTGEAITPEDRESIERATGARVTVTYAGGEVGRLAFECEHRRLHLNEEWAYVEIADAHGAPVPAGTFGHILVTVFDNDVMPLIRYDNGDQGAISTDPCPCGRGLRTIEMSGRQVHVLTFPDGRVASVLDIKARFDRLSGVIDQYQIVRTGPVAFTMRIVAADSFEERREALADMFVRAIHPEATIAWELVESIAPLSSGKAAYFIDRTVRHD